MNPDLGDRAVCATNESEESDMEFGFYVPTKPPLNTPESMRALVSRGEELGYGYLAVGDHIVVPNSVESTYPYSDAGDWPAGRSGEVLEPLSMLAWHLDSARFLCSVQLSSTTTMLSIFRKLTTWSSSFMMLGADR